jgi:hypothetical protein
MGNSCTSCNGWTYIEEDIGTAPEEKCINCGAVQGMEKVVEISTFLPCPVIICRDMVREAEMPAHVAMHTRKRVQMSKVEIKRGENFVIGPREKAWRYD